MKYCVLFLCLFFYVIKTVDIGSDTAVTRFDVLQILADGDRIAGFAELAAGFSLSGVGVTGTFDSFFPVIGDVSLSFGHLILNQDLIFHSNSQITKLGQISGNGHVIDLSSNMNCIPTNFGPSCDISFLDSAVAPATINGVDWNVTSTLVGIATNSGGDDLSVYRWDGAALTLEDSVNLLRNARSVAWHPTNDWVAVGINGGAGDDIFIYTFTSSSLVLLDSVDIGGASADINSIAWHPDGAHLALGTNSTAEIQVHEVNGSGIFGASTSVELTENVNAVDWDSTGSFLAVGTTVGGSFDELRTYTFTGSPLGLGLDASFDVGEVVNSVSWNKRSPDTDIIAIGLNGGPDRVQIYRHSPGSLINLSTSLGISTNVNSVDWHSSSACLAAGLNSSSGFEVRIFLFSDDTLTLDSNTELGSNTNTVRWSRGDGDYLATGDNSNDLTIYQFDSNFTDPTSVTFSNVKLFMHSNLTLHDTSITFSGESIIDGGGSVLTLSPTFSLIVGEQSSLLLRDITLEGVSDAHIRGLDEQSTFSLQNVCFVLDEDFTFTVGRLDILREFRIEGANNTFAYCSDQQLTIRGGFLNSADPCSPFYTGALIVDFDVTFSYAPPSDSATLLTLENGFSRIMLNGGNLVANTLSLTKGIFQVDGKSTLQATTSITFGDGTVANNLDVNLLPAANLNVIGNLIYNNV